MNSPFSFLSSKCSSLKRKFTRLLFKPTFPRVHDGLCLHIGCGTINIPGWVNIDARPFSHVHIISKNIVLSEFTDSSVSAIYLCHVLEHFPFSEVESVLRLFYKKLKPGGVLYLAVPDFAKIVHTYASTQDISAIVKPLMGGQEYEHNFHYAIFDQSFLTSKLLSIGFVSTSHYESVDLLGQNYQDFSTHPLSLNIKAVK